MADSTQILSLAGAATGTVLGVLAVAGVGWRVMLPWLRAQIVEPVRATRRQVEDSSHGTSLRNDLDRLHEDLAALREAVNGVDETATRIGGQLDAHLTAAATMDASTNARLSALEAKRRR